MSLSIEINLSRLNRLCELYGVTKDMIINTLNQKHKQPLLTEDIFNQSIKQSTLKQIDQEFFKKGLSFYTDPNPFNVSAVNSIFCRKTSFNANLKHDDRFRVNKIQEEVSHLDAIIRLSGYQRLERKLKTYSVSDSPNKVAYELRQTLDITSQPKQRSPRAYLQSLISLLGEFNIVVHEFIESHNANKKSSWMGMFLAPHSIAIKRNQKSIRREIFTLAHEFGHYLLDKEEIDKNPLSKPAAELKNIEDWCNDFAIHFLLGQQAEQIHKQFLQDPDIDNAEISAMSDEYHISRLAIYTHLAVNKHINWDEYSILKEKLSEQNEQSALASKLKRQEQRLKNPAKKPPFASSKLIHSSLVQKIYRHAYFAGTIEEIDVINRFKPTLKEIRKGYFDEFLYGETLHSHAKTSIECP